MGMSAIRPVRGVEEANGREGEGVRRRDQLHLFLDFPFFLFFLLGATSTGPSPGVFPFNRMSL